MKEKLHEKTIDASSINKIASKYVSEAILIINKQGKIEFASESAEHVLEIKKKLLQDTSILKFKWLKILTLKNLNSPDSPLYAQPHRFTVIDKKRKSRFIELTCFKHKEDRSGEVKSIVKLKIIDDQNITEAINDNSIDKYNTLFSNTSLGIIEVDKNEKIIFANKGFEKISGYTENELKGKYGPSIFLDDESQRIININQRKKRHLGNEGFYEIRVKSKKMGHRDWIVSGTPIYDKNGNIKGSIGIHWDITDSRKMEAKVSFDKIQKEKQLIENQLQAEEKQKEKIGRDLHDGVGQMLVYLSLHLKLIKEKKSIRKDDLEKTEKTIQQIINEIRNLSRDFAAPAIKELGLKDAVIELIGTFSILTKPNFKLIVYKGPDPEMMIYEQKIILYRIIQELCSNTFKHANASQVEIELIKNKNELYLKYKDNGIGFDPQKNNKGIGLKGILSRIEYYGGKLVLKSKHKKGIEVLINLPIN